MEAFWPRRAAGGLFNGRSATYSDYNRVTRSMRQPGSAMKPFVYLAAFRSGGFTLETLVPDEPISVPDGEARPPKWISNYDGEFKGLIPLRQALAESRNAVAIWITQQIGIDSVLRTAQSLGVRTPLARYATTALGASEVSLLELANVYRTIASGIVAEPHVIRVVVEDSGEVVAVRHAPSPTSIDGVALSLIQEGLRGVVRLPTGHGSCPGLASIPDCRHGKNGNDERVQRCDLRRLDIWSRRHHRRGPDRLRRQPFSWNERDRGEIGAAGVSGIDAGRVHAQVLGTAPAFPARMEERIAASLVPPDPLLTTDVVADRVAIPVQRAGHQSLAPGETDWLLQIPQLLPR